MRRAVRTLLAERFAARPAFPGRNALPLRQGLPTGAGWLAGWLECNRQANLSGRGGPVESK